MGAEIKTMQEFNAYLAADGWDGLPEAAAPSSECQSKTRSATSADDDYTDAVAEWLAARAAWLSEPQEEWEEALAAWLAADPDREAEDFPTPPPEPREAEDFPTEEPEKPANYDDVEHGSWAPFERPDGEDEDEVPTLYRELRAEGKPEVISGNGAYGFDGGGNFTTRYEYTLSDGEVTSYKEYEAVTLEGEDPECQVFTLNFTGEDLENVGQGNLFLPAEGDWVEEAPPAPECTATRKTLVSARATAEVGADPGAPTCPGPWGAEYSFEFFRGTRESSTTETLSGSVTKTEVIARATSKVPEEWPDPAEGDACSSALVSSWPTIASLLSGADPDAEPPVPASWPPCESDALPLPALGSAAVTLARYRYGIPVAWQDWQERKDAFDAWVADGSDPEEAVADPGPRRTTYRLRWQECFFPKVWEEWQAAKDAFDAATAARAAWLAAGSEGPEPIVPADPGDEPEDKPVLGPFKTWTWNSVQAEPFDPSWHEIPLPEIDGETRRVNLGAIDYDSKYGMKYTAHGETYEPA
jgi:hypothetical protein